MRASHPLRHFLPLTLTLVAVSALVWFAGREIETHLNAIDQYLLGLGPWAWLAYLAVFLLLSSFLVPESALALIAGAAFGFKTGLLLAFSGALLSAALQFQLGRRILSGRVDALLTSRPAMRAIQNAVARDQVRLQVLLRLAPLNPAAMNYLLGATKIRFGGFLLCAVILLPHLAVEVLVGHAGRQWLHLSTGTHLWSSQSLWLALAMIVGIGMLAIISKVAYSAVISATTLPAAGREAEGTPISTAESS